jgi:hypothetical protein
MARINKREDDEARIGERERDATVDDLEVPSEQGGDIKGGLGSKTEIIAEAEKK